MKFVKVETLTGNEYLGKAIRSKSDVVLIDEGTQLKQEYIDKLVELGIFSVFIKSEEEVSQLDKMPQPIKEESKIIPKAEAKSEFKTETKAEFKTERPTAKRQAMTKYTLAETKENSLVVVKDVLRKHVYKHNAELKELGQVATKVIAAVVDEPEVIEAVTEIRNISTDIYSHSLNVGMLATVMAIRLRMSEEQIRHVTMGAILHDIGIRYTDVDCDNRYIEELSVKEQIEYKKHTINGYASIQEESWMPDIVKEIILLHHECLDGTGYPFKVTEQKLSPEIRLVSICDCFDSMISGIGSRKHKIYEAIEYLRCNSDTKFDKKICTLFMSTVALYPVGTKVLLSTGEKAVVIEQNKRFMDRPVVRVIEYANGKPCVTDTKRNLVKATNVFITDTID